MPDFSQPASNCSIDFALHILGTKWSIPIMRDLFQGTKRTSELMRSLVGISPRTLSERLRELEEWGLITRKAYAEIPPRVEYSLTPLGRELQSVLVALDTVGRRWQAAMGVERSNVCDRCGRDNESACLAVEQDDGNTRPRKGPKSPSR
jgi:DNA-binding HxlR family transcriptional regulator